MPVMSEEMLKAYSEQILKEAANTHFMDSLAYAFEGFKHQRPPQHGAIDFNRGADGVWRIPRVWSDGDTIHFGFDTAKPGSDRTAYTVWSRT